MSLPPWHPESLAARMPFLRRRLLLCQATRAFFAGRGYTEVETPYAVPTPGEEVHLRAFRTEREYPQGGREPLWLHTSPEFAMKKLLVGRRRDRSFSSRGYGGTARAAISMRLSSPCWNGTVPARTWPR